MALLQVQDLEKNGAEGVGDKITISRRRLVLRAVFGRCDDEALTMALHGWQDGAISRERLGRNDGQGKEPQHSLKKGTDLKGKGPAQGCSSIKTRCVARFAKLRFGLKDSTCGALIG